MGFTEDEMRELMESVSARMRTRSKDEALIKVAVYVSSALRQGASWNDVREAVAQGRLLYDPNALKA